VAAQIIQRFRVGHFFDRAAGCGAMAGVGTGHVRRAAAVQPLQTRALEFQQLPHVRLAYENDEDEDAGQNVEDVGRDPNVGRAADGERDDFHHPGDTHQDEETENHAEPVENERNKNGLSNGSAERVAYFCLACALLTANAASTLAR